MKFQLPSNILHPVWDPVKHHCGSIWSTEQCPGQHLWSWKPGLVGGLKPGFQSPRLPEQLFAFRVCLYVHQESNQLILSTLLLPVPLLSNGTITIIAGSLPSDEEQTQETCFSKQGYHYSLTKHNPLNYSSSSLSPAIYSGVWRLSVNKNARICPTKKSLFSKMLVLTKKRALALFVYLWLLCSHEPVGQKLLQYLTGLGV